MNKKEKKCEYNPKHKLTFFKCECNHCDCCGDMCDCDDLHIGNWICNACERREEKERQAELKRTCNLVMRIRPGMTIKNGKLIQSIIAPIVEAFPHGGKPIRKGLLATIDDEGYLRIDKDGQFLIIS